MRAGVAKCPVTPGEKLQCFWQHPSAEKGEALREPLGQVRGALRAGHFAGTQLTPIPRAAVCLYVCFYFPRHISFSYLSICAPDNYTLRIQLDADLFFTSCPKFSAIKQLLCAWCNEFTQNLRGFGIAERLFGTGLGWLRYVQLAPPARAVPSLPSEHHHAAVQPRRAMSRMEMVTDSQLDLPGCFECPLPI